MTPKRTASRQRHDDGAGSARRRFVAGLDLLLALALAGCGATASGRVAPSSAAASPSPVPIPSATPVAASTSTFTSSPVPTSTPSGIALSALLSMSSTSPSASEPGLVGSTSTPAPPSGASPVAVATVPVSGVPIAGVAPATATALAPTSKAVLVTFETFLQTYAAALRHLDTSHLGDVLDGQALQVITEEVNRLKTQSKPVELVETDHQVGFDRLDTDSAILVDQYRSASVYIDQATGRPLPRTNPPDEVRVVYEFRRFGSAWKIVRSAQKILGTPTP